jgi:hypothetical protein
MLLFGLAWRRLCIRDPLVLAAAIRACSHVGGLRCGLNSGSLAPALVERQPNIGTVSLSERLGWMPVLILSLAVMAVIYLTTVKAERRRHG